MTLPIERFKDSYQNWRYNPFTAADMAVDKIEDGLFIPSGSPFIIQLLEHARYNDPSSVSVRCYGVKTDVDQDSGSGQKVLFVADTTGFSPGDNIIIHRGGAREEEKIIDTVQADISLTVIVNLTYTHTAAQEDDVEKFIAFTETAGSPAQSQFRVDYPPAQGEGTGLVEFNQNDATKEVRINYKATGSGMIAEFMDTKISYPAGIPDDNQIVGFASGAPYWLRLPHVNLAGVSADQHHPQAHTLASHSTKPHSALTGIGANDHHPQIHTHAHGDLTGVSANQHHAQNHASCHHSGGADALAFASIAGFGTYLDQGVKTTNTPSFPHLNLTNSSSKLQGGTKLSIEAGITGVHSLTIQNDTTTAAANMNITTATDGKMRRSTSGRKYKDRIKDLEIDPSLVHKLHVVSFNSLCKDDDKKKRFIGLIADDVEKIFPEIINYNEKHEADSYDNQMLLALVIAELQKLKKQMMN